MAILNSWEINLTTDNVLRAQGADPDVIRLRRPSLITSTDEAILRGNNLLKPIVLFEKYKVKEFRHDRLELIVPGNNRRSYLSGSLIAQHNARAQEVVVMLCTIGHALDETVARLFNHDPLAALALDGFGSAAVEMLAIKASNYFENIANRDGYKTSMPLNPGMVGWPVDVGQAEIFSLVDCEEIGVSLTDSYMMVPNKSVSLVIGIGEELSSTGTACEYCSLQGTCRYQNHYE
jgi:hypothetical protein